MNNESIKEDNNDFKYNLKEAKRSKIELRIVRTD
jgi:hypothetical protein